MIIDPAVDAIELEMRAALYAEHLDEAAFLYEQRSALRNDPEIAWYDSEDFDERFEAHLDALVIGGDLAISIVRVGAAEGGAAEAHVAVALFCRTDRFDLVIEVVDAADPKDEEMLVALEHGLAQEFPGAWLPRLPTMCGRGNAVHDRMATSVLGWRRLAIGSQLLERSEQILAPHQLYRMAGRVREAGALAILMKGVGDTSPATRREAVTALLRIGELDALRHCQQHAPLHPEFRLLLGVSGPRAAAHDLMRAITPSLFDTEATLALGLLGEVTAMPLLHSLLGNKELASTAALSMQLLTGADLYEEVVVNETLDPDEAFEGETETPGISATFTAPTCDPERWRAWWQEHHERFQSGVRYRNGNPCTPVEIVDTLESEYVPRNVRELAYEELVIRYRLDAPFETDQRVSDQRSAIKRYRAWLHENPDKFQPGGWYFNGNLLG